MSELIRILVTDDHPLFREGVVHTLSAEADFAVVGQGASGEDALSLARELLPDIVLLDVTMPGWGGLLAAGKIGRACPAGRSAAGSRTNWIRSLLPPVGRHSGQPCTQNRAVSPGLRSI